MQGFSRKYLLPLFFQVSLASVASNAADEACRLVQQIQERKIDTVAKAIFNGANPFIPCQKNSLVPAHLGVAQFPDTRLSNVIMDYYVNHGEVDANIRGTVSLSKMHYSRSVEESLTLLQTLLLTNKGLHLDKFSKKAGFDPNLSGGFVTASGDSPQTPLALLYYLVFQRNSSLRDFTRDEKALGEIGSTFANCAAIAEIVDPDPEGANLRSAPSARSPVVGRVKKPAGSSRLPAVLLSGYDSKGWFKVSRVFPSGYDHRSLPGPCADMPLNSESAWIHASLIDFPNLSDSRASGQQVQRNLCTGEASIQILSNRKVLIYDTFALLDKIPPKDSGCEK